jgi:hypothetical protein
MPWTNRGAYLMLGVFFRGATAPSTFYAPLYTSAIAPDQDRNTNADMTQIATGNGYSDGGASVARSAAGFDVYTEDDTNNRALVQCADIVYTASGGNLPSSGNGARYIGLTDDNATVANRQIIGLLDLVSDRTVSSGQSLTIQDAEFRITT